MTFRKPFRAVPIRPTGRHVARQRKRKNKSTAILLGTAAFVGLTSGAASVGALPAWSTVGIVIKTLAVSLGLVRSRTPQEGDFWPGCDAARAAGSAPIYAGEAGYRDAMDGDGDGIACEPHRGV